MYYPDLSAYRYDADPAEILAVGWLDAEHPFETGEVDECLLRTLERLTLKPVNQTRGFHQCELCATPPFGLPVRIAGEERTLGSADIEVRGGDGRVFCAPDLLLHYIWDHQYLPPEEFLEALRTCDK